MCLCSTIAPGSDVRVLVHGTVVGQGGAVVQDLHSSVLPLVDLHLPPGKLQRLGRWLDEVRDAPVVDDEVGLRGGFANLRLKSSMKPGRKALPASIVLIPSRRSSLTRRSWSVK
jgi:hypothetical protein